jgi:hypothetical protein
MVYFELTTEELTVIVTARQEAEERRNREAERQLREQLEYVQTELAAARQQIRGMLRANNQGSGPACQKHPTGTSGGSWSATSTRWQRSKTTGYKSTRPQGKRQINRVTNVTKKVGAAQTVPELERALSEAVLVVNALWSPLITSATTRLTRARLRCNLQRVRDVVSECLMGSRYNSLEGLREGLRRVARVQLLDDETYRPVQLLLGVEKELLGFLPVRVDLTGGPHG